MDGGRLNRCAHGEDSRPYEDGATTTEAVGGERLSKCPDESAGYDGQSETRYAGLGSNEEDTTYPAERRDVMIDCRELESVKVPSGFCSPNLCTKSGMIRHPCVR